MGRIIATGQTIAKTGKMRVRLIRLRYLRDAKAYSTNATNNAEHTAKMLIPGH